MIDRTIAPKVQVVESIPLHTPTQLVLPNKRKLYVLDQGDQEVIRFDLMIEAGKWNQDDPLTATFVGGLLKEGCENYTSLEVSELLDSTGSYLQINPGVHHTTISLFALNKHFETMLPLVESVVKKPLFDAQELEKYRVKKFQQYLQDKNKVKILSAQHFKHFIYGGNHPYGKMAKDEDYQNVTADKLHAFHKKYFSSNRTTLLLTGKISSSSIAMVHKYFGGNWNETANMTDCSFENFKQPEKRLYIHKKGAVQSAIHIGGVTISKTHPDFLGLQILNTILGGYFGSRLMQNIREKKGYTYGIGSALIPYVNGGLFAIHTETDNAFCDKVVEEIYNELELLKTDTVGSEELNLVKNYLRGELIRNTDQAFQLAETYHSLLEFGLDFDFMQRYLDTINKISAAELKDLANKYFDTDAFKIVIAGGLE